MGVFQNNLLAASAAAASAGGAAFYDYQIEQSVRLDRDDNDKLTRTPSSAGNRRTLTISFWLKRAEPDQYQTAILQSDDASTVNRTSSINFLTEDNGTGNTGIIAFGINGGLEAVAYSAGRYRDTNGWTHIVHRIDTTQSTNTNRTRSYVNGSLISYADNPGTTTYPGQNYQTGFCNTTQIVVGGNGNANFNYPLAGHLAEVILADGYSYDASYFGEFKNGIWVPKDYHTTTGNYGTTGFYLKFENASDLGNDSSGNNNDFSTNMGADHQVLDSPTFGS
jgi:hypothetical protein